DRLVTRLVVAEEIAAKGSRDTFLDICAAAIYRRLVIAHHVEGDVRAAAAQKEAAAMIAGGVFRQRHPVDPRWRLDCARGRAVNVDARAISCLAALDGVPLQRHSIVAEEDAAPFECGDAAA